MMPRQAALFANAKSKPSISRPKKGKVVEPTPCQREGHNLQKVTDKDRDYWVVVGDDTLLYKTYLCAKCGLVQDIQVGIWQNFVPKSKERRKAEAKAAAKEDN